MRQSFARIVLVVLPLLLCAVLWASAAELNGDSASVRQSNHKGPVAPSPLEPMSPRSQQYLIGVSSVFVVGVAVVLGVLALMRIDYSNDSLLMVEMPEPATTM